MNTELLVTKIDFHSDLSTDFVVEDSAKKRISQLLQKEKPGSFFRVEVIGGGCSGFQYKYGFDQSISKDDDIILDGSVVIDGSSAIFLAHCRLQYIENLGSTYFRVDNPNAKAKCGCGSSFSV